jgi:uncharacterized Fe-S cluster protein YjdI
MKKEYSNGDISVVWKPESCIHSTKCWRGLPEVFQPSSRPWVKVDAATSEQIRNQVALCPSGALSIRENTIQNDDDDMARIEVLKNGPVLVHGNCEIKKSDGSVENKDGVTALCRCGHSNNKPFCDGSHNAQGFQG